MITPDEAHVLLRDVEVARLGDQPLRRPIVAVAHGAGGGVRENFSDLAAADPGRTYVGPYYPGAGSTPVAQGELDFDALSDQVVASGIVSGAQRFPILGLSLGGAVATNAALRHPEHVSALVLTVPLLRADAQSRAFTTTWRSLAASDDRGSLASLMLHSCFTADFLATVEPVAESQLLAELDATAPPGGAAHAALVDRVDLTGRLADIAVPTLLVTAGADRILLPQTQLEYAAIPGTRTVHYPDAGHIFVTHAEQWAADVRAFLDDLA